MYGIMGYAGDLWAASILLGGLARLKYRNYNSAGIVVVDRIEDGTETPKAVKVEGRLEVLCEVMDNGRAVAGTYDIGRTRWATRGKPPMANSHPHCARDKRVAVVHSGIIKNPQEIKGKLLKSGMEFISQTDTGVLVHLLDKYYNGNPIEAITRIMVWVRGSYALSILSKDRSGKIYVAHEDNPLIAGRLNCGSFIASDVSAIPKYTREICFVKNIGILSMTKDSIRLYNIDQDELEPELSRIDWDMGAAEKKGSEHSMLEETYEQPEAVWDTLNPKVKNKQTVLGESKLADREICGLKRIQMVTYDSAYHVCMNTKYIFEQLTRIPVDVDLTSELCYRSPVFGNHILVIVVSQSGGTVDTLAALREAKSQGPPIAGIVNMARSPIVREADYVFYTWARPEIVVATTKAYSAQLAAVYPLATHLGRMRGNLDSEAHQGMIEELSLLPDKISRILEEKERIRWFANKFSHNNDVFLIGRGLDYATSIEGSLKLREMSYIHSEAYVVGELKHGTISPIEDGIWTISIATQDSLLEKLINNTVEVKDKRVSILGITDYGNCYMEDMAGCTTCVPKILKCFCPNLAVIPLQLLAYYVSPSKGLDVDKPRNLTKSVIVE